MACTLSPGIRAGDASEGNAAGGDVIESNGGSALVAPFASASHMPPVGQRGCSAQAMTEMIVAEIVVWGLILAITACFWLFIGWVFRRRDRYLRSLRPNWYEAARLFPIPKGLQSWLWSWTWGGWPKCYVREEPGSRLSRCAMNPTEDGAVIRDAYMAGCVLRIPWSKLREPRTVRLPWYRFLLEEEQIEAEVEDLPITIVMTMDMWKVRDRMANSRKPQSPPSADHLR